MDSPPTVTRKAHNTYCRLHVSLHNYLHIAVLLDHSLVLLGLPDYQKSVIYLLLRLASTHRQCRKEGQNQQLKAY